MFFVLFHDEKEHNDDDADNETGIKGMVMPTEPDKE